MVTMSAISSTSAFRLPAAISARTLAIILVVPWRIQETLTCGCFFAKPSTVCCASFAGWLV